MQLNLTALSSLKVLSSYGNTGSSVALGFACLYFLTKYAGVDVYGQFILLKSTAGLLGGVLSIRSGDLTIKFYKAFEAKEQQNNAVGVLKLGLFVDVFVSTFVLLVIAIAGIWGAELINIDSQLSETFVFFGLTSFFAYLRGTPLGYLQAIGKFTLVNSLLIFESLALVFGLAYLALLSDRFDLESVVILHVIVYFLVTLMFLYFFYFIKKARLGRTPSKLPHGFLKSYLSCAGAFFTSSLFKALNQNGDNLLVGYLLSTYDVGVYQVIKKIYSLLEVAIHPLSILMYPKLTKLFSLKKIDEFLLIIRFPEKLIALGTIAYVILIILALPWIFNFLEVKFFIEYYLVAGLLGFGNVIAALIWWARIFSNIVDPMISVKSNIFMSVYLISFTYMLIYFFDLIGLSVSFLFLNILLLVYIYYCFFEQKKKSRVYDN